MFQQQHAPERPILRRNVTSAHRGISRHLQIIGSAILALLFLVMMLSTAAHAAPPAPGAQPASLESNCC